MTAQVDTAAPIESAQLPPDELSVLVARIADHPTCRRFSITAEMVRQDLGDILAQHPKHMYPDLTEPKVAEHILASLETRCSLSYPRATIWFLFCNQHSIWN